MYRAEIIANRSVLDDIGEALEAAIPELLYTVIPGVHGRGREDRKLGTVTWPEVNFILVAYTADGNLPAIRAVIDSVRKRFPNEGIKLFAVKAEE